MGLFVIIPDGREFHRGEYTMSVRFFRNGGLRFLRIGRLQLSWCIVRRRPTPVVDYDATLERMMLGS